MPELPLDLDLKLMPDWLKEPASKNPYADYEGREDDRRGRGGSDWGRGRDDRRGQRPGGRDERGGNRDNRGPRRDGPGGGGARKPDGRPGGRRPDDRRGKPGDRPRGDGPRHQQVPQQQAAPAQPANVTIEFFPDESCAVSIARQIKSTHRAYSLFELARMFLARPERHRLKITAKSVAEPLHQVGENGPVSLDKAASERGAFPAYRNQYYEEIVEPREAPKGNFANVARCRANGVLLGPTNYHGYQPALRKMYEERFSRRMSFAEFQREIEVVNDPALIEQWKQQASSVTVYRLKQEKPAEEEKPAAQAKEAATDPNPADPATEEKIVETEGDAEAAAAEESTTPETTPEEAGESTSNEATGAATAEEAATIEEQSSATATPSAKTGYDGPVFQNLQEVEQHFRENHLPNLVRTGSTFHVSGDASRAIPDRSIAAAVRAAWEQERGFPGQMMHQLRQQFSRAGLHVFKHRKRMQFVSLIRPSPMENGSLSPSVAEILKVIQGGANCNRTTLAAAILGTDEAAIDQAKKSTLATDLRWLIETGRVIEFSDGKLELPIVPAKAESAKSAEVPAPVTTPEAAVAGETPAAEVETTPKPETAADPNPADAAAEDTAAALEAEAEVSAAQESTVPESLPAAPADDAQARMESTEPAVPAIESSASPVEAETAPAH